MLSSSIPAWADEPRHRNHFASKNGRYVLLNVYRSVERMPVFESDRFVGVMDRKREEDFWGLFDAHAAVPLEPLNEVQTLASGHAPKYVLRGDFRTRTALVSDDGIDIVVLDDFSEHEPAPDLQVLQFYSSGRLVAAYSLNDLLANIGNVRYSTSHFQWFFPGSLKFDRETLSLTTTECVPQMFSTESGEKVATGNPSSGDRPHWQSGCPGAGN